MSRIDFPKIYNPANQSSKELIANFVVRTKLFKDIFDDIKNSEMKYPEQHYIIQGIRGQGKTTLLLRIAYEIQQDKELMERLIPIIFNEEQYSITRLFKLWETTAEYLEEAGEFRNLYDKMQEFENDDDYEMRCWHLLENRLKQSNKKVILFIDNIDEMLNKFTKKEHQRLREIFIESAEIRVIGASSVSLEFHYDYGKPFYQFFKMPQLKGLTIEETKTLLLYLGEYYKRERVSEIVKNQLGRVEALRRITGGVIRTIVILFDIFVDDTNGNAFQDLEKILDSVTPVYKHRMDKLPAQQQEIVDFIALKWDAVTVKEIALKTKLKSKAVSAQLGQLERYHIIEKEKTHTKNYLYRIAERFFNIWYLMRSGRKWDEKRVRFLIEFLQIWCDKNELEKKAKKHLNAVKQGMIYDKHALYWTEALIRTPIQIDLQHSLITETRSFLTKEKSELIYCLSKSDKELKESAKAAYDSNKLKAATKNLEQIKIKDADDFYALGKIHQSKQEKLQAEKQYLKAVEEGHSNAMYNLGILYHNEFKDLQKAEKYFLMAVEKEDAVAMNDLAILYEYEFKDLQKAEKYYLMAVGKEHVYAMNNLAILYENEFKDFQKAEKYYLMAVEKEDVNAMYNLAILYNNEFKDFQKAEKYYLMAVEKEHVRAMNSLAWLYFQEKIHKHKAIKLAKQRYGKQKNIYIAHTYSMILLWNNEIEKAIKIAREYLTDLKALEEFPQDISLFLQLLIAKKQYHNVKKIFNENPHNLKDRFKPVYYALMYFMQDEYPNEYRKMGGELKQTVEEMIAEIKQMEVDYK